MNSSIKSNAGSLIYAKNTGRFLFLLRNADKRYKGTWGIVGGKVEVNEHAIDGLSREIFEEVGKDLSGCVTVPLTVYKSDTSDFEYHTFMIIVEEEFIPALNDEHAGYAWTTLKNYPKPLHPGLWKTVNFSSVQDKIKDVTGIFC